MACLDVPFHPRWRTSMLSGRKTKTCRRHRIGKVDDTFSRFGAVFQITGITQMSLHDVVTHHFYDEGCDSTEELMMIWMKLHPKRGYVSTDRVYLHTFRRSQ